MTAVTVITLATIILCLMLRVPVGFALLAGTFAAALAYAPSQFAALPSVAIQSADDPTLVAIPLFVVAGGIIASSHLMESLLSVLDVVLRRIRGGITISCVGTALLLAGATGSTAAGAAALATSYQEPMRARGYRSSFSGGLIAVSSALGVLVPPGITLILYGSLTGFPVDKLFTAGIAPALLAAVGVVAVAMLLARRQPAVKEYAARRLEQTERRPVTFIVVLEALAVLGLPVLVLGGIYTGLLTVSETAAITIVYVLLFTAVFRKASFRQVGHGFVSGAERAGMVFLIFIAAHVLSYLLTYTGIAQNLITAVTSAHLARRVEIAVVILVLLALGSLVDGLGLLIIVTPILSQLLPSLGLSPVQLGVLLSLSVEVGVVHPPVGLNLYAVGSVTGDSVGSIAKAVLPYIGVLLAVLALVAFVPLPIFQWS